MEEKIYILYGGPSSEREVSFGTRDYFAELYSEYKPLCVEWLENFNFLLLEKEIGLEDFLKILKRKPSLVLIASHGEYVEDGYLQEILERNKISFTGSDAKSCRISINKYETYARAHSLVNCIPTYKSVPKEFDYHKMVSIIGDGYPIFAKPNNLGSSVGIYKVGSKYELEVLLNILENIEYLFQPAIEGTEVSLGTVRDSKGYMKLSPTEIIPENEFFDYEAKYHAGGSKEITPARLGGDVVNKLRAVTNKIHDALGLGYYSRSDFIIDYAGNIFYLETNALPGMTRTSLLPQQLEYAGKIEDFKKGLLKITIKGA